MGGVFDELYDSGGAPRAETAALAGELERLGPDRLLAACHRCRVAIILKLFSASHKFLRARQGLHSLGYAVLETVDPQ